MKNCTCCQQTKPFDQFYPHTNKNGTDTKYYSGRCRDCSNRLRREASAAEKKKIAARKRSHYVDNPQKYRDASKRWRDNHPEYDAKGYGRKRYRTTKGRAMDLVAGARSRSKLKGVPFDLTWTWLYTKLIYGRCEFSDLPFDLSQSRYVRAPRAPSLHRIDPKGGYTKDNVSVVCWQVNMALGDYPENFLRDIVTALAVKWKISSQDFQTEVRFNDHPRQGSRAKRPEARSISSR